AAGHVEIDARRGDRAREDVEGDVADHSRGADVAAEITAAQGEVELRRPPARLADELAHPLATELVAVAIEEDVVLLFDVERRKELGVRCPEERLRPARAELEESRDSAFGVREHEVVF